MEMDLKDFTGEAACEELRQEAEELISRMLPEANDMTKRHLLAFLEGDEQSRESLPYIGAVRRLMKKEEMEGKGEYRLSQDALQLVRGHRLLSDNYSLACAAQSLPEDSVVRADMLLLYRRVNRLFSRASGH